MSVRAIQTLFIAGFVTVSVTVFSPLAKATGGSCAKVYRPASVYGESYSVLRSLLVANYELTNKIKSARDQGKELSNTELAQVPAQLGQIQTLAEAYFQASGLGFRKRSQKVLIRVGDETMLELRYNIYTLNGKPHGDDFSRILYFAENHELYRGPQFHFDLFYELREGTGAHYEFRRNLVVIGPRVIENLLLGINTDIHHEIIHHFENQRMKDGKPTLARIDLVGGKEKMEDPYSESFFLDEVEAHFADIQKLSDKKRIRTIDEGLATQVPPQRLSEIQIWRKKAFEMKRAVLIDLIRRSNQGLEEIERAFKDGRFSKAGKNQVDVYGLKGEYSDASLYLESLPSAQKSMQQQIFNIVAWSKARIREISKQLELASE